MYKIKVNMQSRRVQTLLISAGVVICSIILLSFMQQKDPWTMDQLLDPAQLVATISDRNAVQPVIVSVGPGAVIPNSVDVGPAAEKVNREKFEAHLKTLPSDAAIVIYCGCCPFNKCPNVRPAFAILNEMGFKRHKLLNLTQNIKTDWIDHGYPVVD
jgi:thiosulfate/3-mercaptopyruvate sulfurtransferase